MLFAIDVLAALENLFVHVKRLGLIVLIPFAPWFTYWAISDMSGLLVYHSLEQLHVT